jgi:hypothetical protein
MFTAHRINTIEELNKIPKHIGIEVDLRDSGDKVIMSHDPFVGGEDFEEFMKHYNHSFIILNIKSERIEYKVLEIIKKHNVQDYFLLDSSFPMMYKLSTEGEKNIAIRYSEFESIYSVVRTERMFNWVWVDCFTKLPLNNYVFQLMKINGYKVCIVSPELQGQPEKLETYMDFMIQNNIIPDMICGKNYNYEKWKKIV